MCTLIPVIYLTFCTEKRPSCHSSSALHWFNISVATRCSPWRPWSIHILGNCRLYTHFQLPTSFPTTGTRALPCLKTTWFLIHSPECRGNHTLWVSPIMQLPHLVSHQRLQLWAFIMRLLTSQGHKSLIYLQGKVAITYIMPFLRNFIALYKGLGLKGHNQQMEKPRFE